MSPPRTRAVALPVPGQHRGQQQGQRRVRQAVRASPAVVHVQPALHLRDAQPELLRPHLTDG